MKTKSFGRSLLDGLFSVPHREDGMVRMFEIEYNKEYRNAVRHGITVDTTFVSAFLASSR